MEFRRPKGFAACVLAWAALHGTSLSHEGSESLRRFAFQCQTARLGGGAVRILHLGDSHAASRDQRCEFRDRLQERFGSGGFGLGSPWCVQDTGLPAGASPGWRHLVPADGSAGLAGVCLEARQAGQVAWVEAPFHRIRLHLLRQPGGGEVEVRVDGVRLAQIALEGPSPELVVLDRTLSPSRQSRKLEVRTLGEGPARILGVALEQESGATYGNLALNGAQAAGLLRVDERLFESQVRAESPDLIILAYGTNEANARNFDGAAYGRRLGQLLDRIRRAAPDAAVALAAPPDAQLRQGRPETLARVIGIQRETARRSGAELLDLQALMGGPGSMGTWRRSGLAQGDAVHLTSAGYRKLTRAMVDDLFRRMGGPGLPLEPVVASRSRMAKTLGRQTPGAPSLPVREAAPRPIFTFRTEEGRIIITDEPATLEGRKGQFLGPRPGGRG